MVQVTHQVGAAVSPQAVAPSYEAERAEALVS
jgi:hypothetical protein